MSDQQILEETEENTKIVPFRLVTGGKGPPGGEWLSQIPVNTWFLVREKRPEDGRSYPSFVCSAFKLLGHTEHAVSLFTNTNQVLRSFVDPLRFCQRFELVEILGVDNNEEQEET